MNTISTGGKQNNTPQRAWLERDEIAVWTVVSSFIKKEKRTDGEIAYVVSDIGDLVMGIMDHYEQIYSKKN